MPMSLKHSAFTSLLFGLTYLLASSWAMAQTTAFTYQGKLTNSGSPANGQYDLEFKLFDTATVGTGTRQDGTFTASTVTPSSAQSISRR